MISDRLQYFLEDVCNFEKCDQIWTLGPHIYHQNISKETTNEKTLENNIFISESDILKVWEGLYAKLFEAL